MSLSMLDRIETPEGYSFDPYCSLYLPFHDGRCDGSSFMSHDHYGHLVTVEGAKWHPIYGRWFDGGGAADDVITVPNHTAIQNIFDSPGGTIVAWINPASVGEGGYGKVWDKVNQSGFLITDSGSGTCKSRFFQRFTSVNGSWDSTNYVITYNRPQMVSISYDNSNVANDPIICLDSNPVAITETGTPVGTRTTDAANSLRIGNDASTAYTFDGYINALWAFKGKMLSPVELRQIFLATKDRFGR